MANRTCSVEGCDRKIKARGLCGKHYQAWRTANGIVGHAQRATCSVSDCESFVHATGYCRIHYRRMRKYGDPHRRDVSSKPETLGCLADGCEEKHHAFGYCKNHYQQRYYAATIARQREYGLAYRSAHREELRAQTRKWVSDNPERARQANKAYREANRDALRKKRRAYRDSNRDKIRALNNRRKALQRNVSVNDLTAEQWRSILDAHEWRCAYCGDRPDEITMDHVVPLSRGGGNTAANVVPACGPCNSAKGDREAPPFAVHPITHAS